jgi:hypothetical protein
VKKNILVVTLFILSTASVAKAQRSVARRWNDVMIYAIRQDRARPPVQARNLYHFSIAVYDAWAAYSSIDQTVLLGKTFNGINYPYNGMVMPANIDSAREVTMSYAAYRLLYYRYNSSPGYAAAFVRFDTLMNNLGLNKNFVSEDYSTGNPAALGNYLAKQIIDYGNADGSNEMNDYEYTNYAPINTPLSVKSTGNVMEDILHWQPLKIDGAKDQAGNPAAAIQNFVCPEWGRVHPFALPDSVLTHKMKNGGDFPIYFDPGEPPTLDTLDVNNAQSLLFKHGHTMVALWSAHHDPDDTLMMDISPASIGNITQYPNNFDSAKNFYHYLNGGSIGIGHSINPITNMPYTPQVVKRGDYTRVLTQFWADGPQSETPPGHWFALLHDVSDHATFQRKWGGVGPLLTPLEWDVKSYLTLGGAMHDAAIACWGIKGWYDSPRPISAIRAMATFGQCSDSTLPHYHAGGLPLIPNYIELITATDSLVGDSNQNLNKIKIKSWRGFDTSTLAANYVGHVGWILAEQWLPYQRKTFVTPPFAGYMSGHSTYSRAGATVMKQITGSPFFPGGIAQYLIKQNAGFLVFEKGPTQDITLQWAMYKDASDEASLSRIWGGIHPYFDDFVGRNIGEQIGNLSVAKAQTYFSGFSLPSQLVQFNGIENNCKVNLHFMTEAEKNVASYSIYASPNGQAFTKLIGRLPAQSKPIANYQITDEKPFEQNMYQLIAEDWDGKKQIYPLLKINMTKCNVAHEAWLNVYPNPVEATMNLSYFATNTDETITVNIVDMMGRVLMSKAFLATNGINQFTLPTNNLGAGQYAVSTHSSQGNVLISKFSKYK